MKYIFIITVLFFPLKLFLPYHLLLASIALFMVCRNKKLYLGHDAKLILLLFLFILVSSVFRSVYLQTFNFRDYMELFRYVPLVLFLLVSKKYKIEYEVLCKILFVYTAIDFSVSLFQTSGVGFIDTVSNIYASDFHMENSLGISSRAIGLSRGPGDHGAIMAVMLTFFFSNIFYKYNKFNILGCCIACLTILLSQSQTSFVAMVFVTAVILFYYLIFGRKLQRVKAQKITILLVLCSALFVIYFFKDLKYLYTLVELGTDRNSFQIRLEKMDFVHTEIAKNPELFLIGFGKDYWGDFSSAMDNEYLYIYSVYGLVVFLFAVFVALLQLTKGLLVDSSLLNKGVYFVIIAGFVIAYPTSFFTEPRTIMLLVFLGLLSQKNDKQVAIDK